jgi:hypothetical protein
MNFKLKYQLIQTTNLESELLIERMQLVLNDKGYRLINITNDSVKFDTNPWKFEWNFSPTTLDGGEFKITASNDERTIHLDYYFNILPGLFSLLFLIMVVINAGEYDGVLFFGSFFLIASVVHIFVLKGKAKELLHDIQH